MPTLALTRRTAAPWPVVAGANSCRPPIFLYTKEHADGFAGKPGRCGHHCPGHGADTWTEHDLPDLAGDFPRETGGDDFLGGCGPGLRVLPGCFGSGAGSFVQGRAG